ncbi:MAG: HAD-IA family hydrolase [Nitrososphaerota archaeon]|nr:HAD-IA family hydrolase [Nitrososphaerota archaeon]MDG6916372.1 HAD-IA family hydrolase [Nitrososphaerota archaeon]MDG6947491.1 HAD-IA family hydrolase [Nitrososphaerota archaeon]
MPTLLCDVGGVLIENPWKRASQEVGEQLGRDPGEVFRLLSALSKRLDMGELTLAGVHRTLAGALGGDYPFARFEETLDAALRKVQPVWEAVRALGRRGDWEVMALSNMSWEVWDSLQRKFGISSLFGSAVLSFEHGVVKPDPAIYRLALGKARSPPCECTFVDDVPENIEAAGPLGIRTYLAEGPSETARFIMSLGDRRYTPARAGASWPESERGAG